MANDGELNAAMEQVNKIRERAALDVNIIKNEDGNPAANYSIKTYPASHAAPAAALSSYESGEVLRLRGDYAAAEAAYERAADAGTDHGSSSWWRA